MNSNIVSNSFVAVSDFTVLNIHSKRLQNIILMNMIKFLFWVMQLIEEKMDMEKVE